MSLRLDSPPADSAHPHVPPPEYATTPAPERAGREPHLSNIVDHESHVPEHYVTNSNSIAPYYQTSDSVQYEDNRKYPQQYYTTQVIGSSDIPIHAPNIGSHIESYLPRTMLDNTLPKLLYRFRQGAFQGRSIDEVPPWYLAKLAEGGENGIALKDTTLYRELKGRKYEIRDTRCIRRKPLPPYNTKVHDSITATCSNYRLDVGDDGDPVETSSGTESNGGDSGTTKEEPNNKLWYEQQNSQLQGQIIAGEEVVCVPKGPGYSKLLANDPHYKTRQLDKIRAKGKSKRNDYRKRNDENANAASSSENVDPALLKGCSTLPSIKRDLAVEKVIAGRGPRARNVDASVLLGNIEREEIKVQQALKEYMDVGREWGEARKGSDIYHARTGEWRWR